MTSRAPSATTSTSTTAPVRRNLFHHHLSRRPTAPSSSSTASTTMAETEYPPTYTQPRPTSHTHHDDSEEMIVKLNGKYDVQALELPAQEEGEEGGALAEGMEEVEGERERLERQLLEMYRNRSLQPGEPGELLAAVHASLRRKVAGLDADNWMFEGGGEGKAGMSG